MVEALRLVVLSHMMADLVQPLLGGGAVPHYCVLVPLGWRTAVVPRNCPTGGQSQACGVPVRGAVPPQAVRRRSGDRGFWGGPWTLVDPHTPIHHCRWWVSATTFISPKTTVPCRTLLQTLLMRWNAKSAPTAFWAFRAVPTPYNVNIRLPLIHAYSTTRNLVFDPPPLTGLQMVQIEAGRGEGIYRVSGLRQTPPCPCSILCAPLLMTMWRAACGAC